MSYAVEWTKGAAKQLLAIDKKQRILIASWVKDNLDGCENPKSLSNGKRLEGTEDGWRWRVGKYRILGRILENRLVIEVVRVGHRSQVYRKLPKI